MASRPLYSHRFIALQGLAGTSSSVTVPNGFVYVVKQVTIYTDPLLAQVAVFFQDDVSGAALFADAANPGAGKWSGFYGALTFGPGDGFHFHVATAGPDAADVYCGGYVLSSP